MAEKQGERFKKIREELGLTQKEVADELEFSNNSTISSFENGSGRGFGDKSLKIFCRNHNVNYDWIITGRGERYLHSNIGKANKEVDNSNASQEISLSSSELHKLWQDEMSDRRAESDERRKVTTTLMELAKEHTELMKAHVAIIKSFGASAGR